MPRIQTTPMVKIALWALRIYLLVLLSLIGLKFSRVFSRTDPAATSPPAPPGPAATTNLVPTATPERR